ncbi:PREDICTED: uncharacterized protein LOC107164064 [Diuraphis noxia]|uniref:uncharacterized protein LOC107164064 n=1 Tax=Diuraphis noxia TaxID=143948 RepID=UPI000763B8D3|nr:PREDICTED: uncharacterized protein LOC107164064 [Diuraphis noxia]
MTAKISVFAVVLILAYVKADFQQPPTLTMYLPSMPYYPISTPNFNDFKKSVYTMNQALLNLIGSARSAFDYRSLYKDQDNLNLDISEKLSKFEKAIDYFENKLLKYRQSLIKYKNELGFIDSPVYHTDDRVSIDPNILL